LVFASACWALRRDLGGAVHRRFEKLIARHHSVDQADLLRRLRVDQLAGQQEITGDALPRPTA
jgi:hypothetical protein